MPRPSSYAVFCLKKKNRGSAPPQPHSLFSPAADPRALHSLPTRRSSDLQNQRYGSSHIGATAKDISNVVTDAASGVVDIFHGIDKAVADTWNNINHTRSSIKIGRAVQQECRDRARMPSSA